MIVTAGAGRMGRSIALALALAGHQVAVLDLKARSADDAACLIADARAEIGASLRFLAQLNVVSDVLLRRSGLSAPISPWRVVPLTQPPHTRRGRIIPTAWHFLAIRPNPVV